MADGATSSGGAGPASKGETRVWLARADECPEGELLDRWSRALSDRERERIARFVRSEDRHLHLLAHVLKRAVLASCTGRDPAALAFEEGPHGRPELRDRRRYGDLRFNLSHTRGLAALALSFGAPCGIDVEHPERGSSPLHLADRVLSADERAALLVLPEEERIQHFYRLWTLKEAWLKATGEGIGGGSGLSSIAFECTAGDPPRPLFAPPSGDDPGEWTFLSRTLATGHILALAVQRAPELESVEIHEHDTRRLLFPD